VEVLLEAHAEETARMEVADRYEHASGAHNRTAIAAIAFAPSVSAVQAHVRDVFGRMVTLGFVDPPTDVPPLLDQVFRPVTGDLPVGSA
jgi:hypothetical protein